MHDAFDQAVSMIDYVRENLRDDARVADLHCSNVLAVCKQIRSDIKDTNESLRLLREGMTRQDGISAGKKQVARMLYVALTAALRHGAHQGDIGDRSFQRLIHHAGRISDAWINFEPDLESYEQDYEKELRKLIREYRREDIAIARDPVFDGNTQGLHQKERIPRRERRDEDELEEVEQSQANVRLDKGDSTPYVNRERRDSWQWSVSRAWSFWPPSRGAAERTQRLSRPWLRFVDNSVVGLKRIFATGVIERRGEFLEAERVECL